MTSRISTALILLLPLYWAIQTRHYAEVWTDRLPLARHVAMNAPEKPGPLMNYGVLLATRGRFAASRALLSQAEWASHYEHIRPWDRRFIQEALAQNMAALTALESQLMTP